MVGVTVTTAGRRDVGTEQEGCPIEKTLQVIGKKWMVLIIRDLLQGPRRFTDLLRSLGRISPKTLSERLKEMEEKGVASRRAYAEVPPRVEYSLTERGRSLAGILQAMADWGHQL